MPQKALYRVSQFKACLEPLGIVPIARREQQAHATWGVLNPGQVGPVNIPRGLKPRAVDLDRPFRLHRSSTPRGARTCRPPRRA